MRLSTARPASLCCSGGPPYDESVTLRTAARTIHFSKNFTADRRFVFFCLRDRVTKLGKQIRKHLALDVTPIFVPPQKIHPLRSVSILNNGIQQTAPPLMRSDLALGALLPNVKCISRLSPGTVANFLYHRLPVEQYILEAHEQRWKIGAQPVMVPIVPQMKDGIVMCHVQRFVRNGHRIYHPQQHGVSAISPEADSVRMATHGRRPRDGIANDHNGKHIGLHVGRPVLVPPALLRDVPQPPGDRIVFPPGDLKFHARPPPVLERAPAFGDVAVSSEDGRQ
mmetsp:Transcript_43074/g.90491  ORF Transcript_43074/g.90491 Transcript_43074/m.90491 type:complete len:281 (+) Transcript_43074:231-1073(+)